MNDAAVDFQGSEDYDIHFKAPTEETPSKDIPTDVLEETSGNFIWCSDDRAVLYTTRDEVDRPDKLWLHVVGTPQEQDTCLFTEPDERFFFTVDKTRSGKYAILGSESKMTSECQLLDLDEVNAWVDAKLQGRHGLKAPQLRMVQPRIENVLYMADHWRWADAAGTVHEALMILTNHGGAKNFKLCVTSPARPAATNWIDLIPHRPEVFLEEVECFKYVKSAANLFSRGRHLAVSLGISTCSTHSNRYLQKLHPLGGSREGPTAAVDNPHCFNRPGTSWSGSRTSRMPHL